MTSISSTTLWELIDRENVQPEGWTYSTTERLKVPGGWLYRIIVNNGAEHADAVAVTFVPDEETKP